MSIFRAYDIRGIVGETLTEELVERIAQAIGSEAQARGQQTIVVARDGRLSGPLLQAALIRGLLASGCDVIDIGMMPTPVLYFATHYFNTGSGVMLTGSHNPPNYNGLKIMLAGKTLFGEAIAALKTRLNNNYLLHGQGNLQQGEIADAYIQRVISDVKLANGRTFKVVIDCGNGVAGTLAPRLLREMGCEVIELYCDVDGNFPNHHPDPTQPKNVQDLIRCVQENQADLGLGFDGDGDRLGVIDSQGNIIWPDRQMMLYARDILVRHPNACIIYDVKCSKHLDSVIKAAGGEAIMWKTGHSFMKNKLVESGGLLAGEMSGHIFFKERWYGFDDALYTAARLLEILSKEPNAPHQVFAHLPDAINTPELQILMQEGEHFEFMQKFMQQATFNHAEVFDIDGLRVNFADGWGLVRPSNTTPCLVLRFEADNQVALQRIQTLFKQQLLAIKSDLSLPF